MDLVSHRDVLRDPTDVILLCDMHDDSVYFAPVVMDVVVPFSEYWQLRCLMLLTLLANVRQR